MRARCNRPWINLLVCAAVAVSAAAPLAAAEGPPDPAGKSPVAQADNQKSAEQPAAQQQTEPPEQPDPFAVPDGTPQELLDYIESFKGRRPESAGYDEMFKFSRKANRATLEAADKILAGKPTAEQAAAAVRWKLDALATLDRMSDPEIPEKLKNLPAELEKAGMAEFAREAKSLLLGSRLRATMGAPPEEAAKLVEEVKSYLSEAPPARNDVSLVMMTAYAAETSGNSELAAAAYRDFAKILSASEDEMVTGISRRMEGAARRLSLLGNKMHLEGVTLAGEPFDWSRYEGKVVLVDFWATWCGPCLAELPNVKKSYDLYHDRGFDVVAISLDSDRERLETFLEGDDLPWTVLFDADPTAESMGDYYGIIGIPTVILVGPDGNVVSLGARGRTLGNQLKKLLGPAEEKKEAAEENEQPKTAEKKE